MSKVMEAPRGEQILMDGNNLVVPNKPIIPFIEGDGTGPDIWNASKIVLDAAVSKAYNEEKEISFKYSLTPDFINQILEKEHNAKGLVRRNIYKELDSLITSFAKGQINDN